MALKLSARLSHPCRGLCVVVDEEGPSIGRAAHLPASGKEAAVVGLLGAGGVLGRRLRGAQGRRLGHGDGRGHGRRGQRRLSRRSLGQSRLSLSGLGCLGSRLLSHRDKETDL